MTCWPVRRTSKHVLCYANVSNAVYDKKQGTVAPTETEVNRECDEATVVMSLGVVLSAQDGRQPKDFRE